MAQPHETLSVSRAGEKVEPVGLGGWLIVVQFQLIFAMLVGLSNIVRGAQLFWYVGASMSPSQIVVGLMNCVAFTALIGVGAIFLLVQCRRRSRMFPDRYFEWSCAAAFFAVLSYFASDFSLRGVTKAEYAAGWSGISAASTLAGIKASIVSIFYVRRSKRVANTFTN